MKFLLSSIIFICYLIASPMDYEDHCTEKDEKEIADCRNRIEKIYWQDFQKILPKKNVILDLCKIHDTEIMETFLRSLIESTIYNTSPRNSHRICL